MPKPPKHYFQNWKTDKVVKKYKNSPFSKITRLLLKLYEQMKKIAWRKDYDYKMYAKFQKRIDNNKTVKRKRRFFVENVCLITI